MSKKARVLNARPGSVAPAKTVDTPSKDIREAQEDAGIALRYAGVNPLARRLADKIGPATFQEFESAVNSDEYQKVIGLLMADHIRDDFTADEIAAVPVCILKADAEEYYEAHKNSAPNTGFDWTKVKDGKKTKWVSFFDTMLESTPWIVSLRKQVEDIADVIATKEGYKQALKAQFPNPGLARAHKLKLEKRITTTQAKWRTGWRMVQQEVMLESLIGDHVLFSTTREKDGSLIAGPAPIFLEKVQEKGVTGRFDNFSVTSFLSLDIEAAVANRIANTPSETWDALIDTLKKDEPEGEADPDNIVISNGKRFETGMASMLAFMKDHPEVITGMIKKINGAKDLSEVAPLTTTIGDLASDLWAMKQHVQKKYEDAHVLEQINSGRRIDPELLKQAVGSR